MNLSTRSKHWLKILTGLLLVVAAGAGILLYVIEYRLKEVVQVIVSKESKGVYGFNADKIDISFLKRNIVIKEAALYCNDTLNTSPHYDVKIPQVYLAIQSWRDLIFNKKMSVDSFFILEPQITSHQHFARKAKPVAFQASSITSNIEKLLKQLQVRSFQVKDASFAFSSLNSPAPLSGDHISFSVRNFSKKESDTARLFSSDDINLTMGPQHWILPDGKHDIQFKGLHFSGKNQFFELDSCVFLSAATETKAKMNLSADKIIFNSKKLASSYENDELLIDTIICFRPVLKVESNTKNIKQQDSSVSVSQSIGKLFTKINIKFIDVMDGEFSIINMYRPNYQTQKANLKAYNLTIGGNEDRPVTTDSIHLNLRNLSFLTTDSLFALTVGEFNLNNRDVLFKNAVYAPTARNRNEKGFTFTTRLLHVKNINLSELMNKRIVADTAELSKPVITVYDRTKRKNKPGNDSSLAQVEKSPREKKSFYQTLHGLSELIAVEHFNILNGSLGFTASGAVPLRIDMKSLNASILLSKLFGSDSLIDIKRSLPEVSAGELTVQSPQLNLGIKNYVFNGDRRHNRAEQFQLSMENGTTVKGSQLYWEIFDWDMYANHKIILIEYLKLQDLVIKTRKKNKSSPAKSGKDLPELHIARFDIDHLAFNDSTEKSVVSFNATAICADNIGSRKKFFTWNNAEAMLSNLSVNSSASAQTVTVNKIKFNTQYGTAVQETKIDINNDKGYTRVSMPLAKIVTDIHSTDFSSIHLTAVEADNANIDIYKKHDENETATASKPVTIPVALAADKLLVKKATVKYTGEGVKDTLAFTTGISLDATGITTFKKQQNLFNYDKLVIGFSDLLLNKGKLNLGMQELSIALAKGSAEKNTNGKIKLQSGVLVKWTDAGMKLKQTDSTGIVAQNFSGSFSDAAFQLNTGTKIRWQPLVHKTAISKGNAVYRGKNITATAGSVAWNPKEDKLSLRSFSVLPNMGMNETFSLPNAWQGDYMTIAGEAVDILGIRYHSQEDDPSLTVKKIVLDSVSLTTTRDKRMPFKHGVEKPMPVVMINKIKMPLQVDSVIVHRSKVTVNEIAIKSKKQGTVPLTNINAVITNLKNRSGAGDSLTIAANARLINYKVDKFIYKEAYGDSLSYFFANVHVSPMALPEFSTVTIPLASIGVDKGNADTLYARWAGNKYAAVGQMNFYYKGLKIRLLDAKDNTKKNFILSLGTSVAGLILNKNNDEASYMYFLRDREKFIFNYWVKTMLAGLSTSAGIKGNKKMMKKYRKAKTQYSLPVLKD